MGSLPSLIIAIVVYHGFRPWSTPFLKELHGNIPPVFQKYVLHVNFILTDVGRLPDSLIETNEALGVLRSVPLALKCAFDARQLEQNFADTAIFVVGGTPTKINEIFLEMLFVYVQKRLDMDVREMENLIESLLDEPRATALSTYDKIIEKGRQEGIQLRRQEGIQISIEQFVLNLIRQTDMSDEQIAQLVGVEVAYVAALRKPEKTQQ